MLVYILLQGNVHSFRDVYCQLFPVLFYKIALLTSIPKIISDKNRRTMLNETAVAPSKYQNDFVSDNFIASEFFVSYCSISTGLY